MRDEERKEWKRKPLKKRWIIPHFYDVTLSDFLVPKNVDTRWLSGEYICEVENSGEPVMQTNKLQVLGKHSNFRFAYKSTNFPKAISKILVLVEHF